MNACVPGIGSSQPLVAPFPPNVPTLISVFGSQDSIAAPETQNHLNEKIESLETQLSSLQQKVIDLEAKLENPKSPRSGLLEGLESTKSIQQSDSTLEVKKLLRGP